MAVVDHRKKNVNWWVTDANGNPWMDTRDQATVALLMDIRDELQTLNRLLGCPNFTGIPETLRQISRHTKAKRKYTKGPL